MSKFNWRLHRISPEENAEYKRGFLDGLERAAAAIPAIWPLGPFMIREMWEAQEHIRGLVSDVDKNRGDT